MPKAKTEKKEFVVTGANPDCTRCALCKDSKVVCTWGNGNIKAEIMLIGDTPFSIESDKLLNKYLQLSGIDRQTIFVDLVCRCKTPMNRTLKPAEIKACAPYLDYQINQIKPKVIGLLGAVALERVLGIEGITKFRGKPVWSDKYNCWCVPTWHPSYILRSRESLEETEQFRRDLEFMKKIAETGDTGQRKTTYDVIDSIELFDAMMTCLKSYKVASLDTETYGDYLTGKIITIQFSIKVGTAFVIPFYRADDKTPSEIYSIWPKAQQDYIWNKLKEYLENPEYKKVGQNIKYDYQFLKLYGIILKGVIFDTMLGHYLLDENKKGQHDLGTMALNYTDMGDYSIDFYNNLKCEPEEIKYKIVEAPFEALCRYACKDADATFRIFCVLYPKIKQQGLETLLQKVMIPLSFVLGEMELTGVLVDTEYYKKLALEYETKIKELEDEFNSYPDVKLLERKQGKPVNFNSSDQMRALFYVLLKLPVYKMTGGKNKKKKNKDSAKPSTDHDTLTKLAELHPIPKSLLKHRTFNKFLSTYIKPIPELLYSDGRLHTNYFQQVTVTGRLSSSKPNLQNIPKKEPEMAMQIRRGLVATEGYTFIESDLGQIEFRLLANECRDETMLKDISSGLDIHKTIASIAFKVSYDKVTPEIREKAKTILYSIVYGKGEENLAKETGFTVEQVQAIFGAIYRRYPRVKPYMLSLINRAKTTGEVTNWIGRRRRLMDGFKSGVEILMAEAERQAVNSPIQSGAHDILSVATIKIYSELKRRNLKSRLVLTIHDSLVLEVKNEELNEAIKLVKTIMETSPSKKIIVPLIVDIAVGTKLGEMKKLTKEETEKILNG